MAVVLILGAGFSRAISDAAPLTDELGNLVVSRIGDDRLPSPPRGFVGGSFETWLSRLAEDQPDLSVEANLLNRHWFARITKAIHEIIAARELDILAADPPTWLLQLLGVAHARQMSMITFNYDTLVEHAVMVHQLFDWEHSQRATWHDIVDHLPPLPPQPARWSGAPAKTFRFVKLHGSANAYWVPGDSSGATINGWDLFGGWGRPEPVDQERLQRELPGRSPFIVPPTAAKSAYYDNPLTRELWRRAASALGTASRVVLLGYSLPATDLVVSGMLREQLTSRPVEIDVVDLSPGPIGERLERLGVDPASIRRHDGDTPIPDFVDALEAEVCRTEVRDVLDRSDEHVPLLVATSEGLGGAVIEVRPSATHPSEVEFVVDHPLRHVLSATQAPWKGTTLGRPIEPVRVADLRRVMVDGRDTVRVAFDTGHRSRVVRALELETNVARGERWLVLVPSTVPKINGD